MWSEGGRGRGGGLEDGGGERDIGLLLDAVFDAGGCGERHGFGKKHWRGHRNGEGFDGGACSGRRLAPRVSGMACGETAAMGMGADISGRRRELSCSKGEKAGRVGVAAGLVTAPMPDETGVGGAPGLEAAIPPMPG